jgi:hypothetical protein
VNRSEREDCRRAVLLVNESEGVQERRMSCSDGQGEQFADDTEADGYGGQSMAYYLNARRTCG